MRDQRELYRLQTLAPARRLRAYVRIYTCLFPAGSMLCCIVHTTSSSSSSSAWQRATGRECVCDMGRGRAPCCAKVGLNRGSWTPQEDARLVAYIKKHGHANWRALPRQAGLLRCGKSCRLRWINYLRPDLRRGNFTADEEATVIKLHASLGNKWSKIAACLPGRTDNEIKNVWNTHLKKRVAEGEKQHEGKPGAAGNNGTSAGEAGTPDASSSSCSASSASSSATVTTSNGSVGDAGEQCGTSKEPDTTYVLPPLELEPDIDISDMLVDAPSCEAVAMPTSPCSSSSLTTWIGGGGGVEELLDLPEIDMDTDIWSLIDGNNGDATVQCNTTANAVTVASQEEEGTDCQWWLEDLERELGLWGHTEESQAHAGPTGQIGGTERDSVSTYFHHQGPPPMDDGLHDIGSSAVLL